MSILLFICFIQEEAGRKWWSARAVPHEHDPQEQSGMSPDISWLTPHRTMTWAWEPVSKAAEKCEHILCLIGTGDVLKSAFNKNFSIYIITYGINNANEEGYKIQKTRVLISGHKAATFDLSETLHKCQQGMSVTENQNTGTVWSTNAKLSNLGIKPDSSDNLW